MNRNQGILLTLALAATLGLYALPKAVVTKDNQQIERQGKEDNLSSTPNPAGSFEAMHSKEIAAEDAQRLDILANNFRTVSDTKKKVIFADSLASLYVKLNRLDSAATYYERMAMLEPSRERKLRAAEGYYEAATFSTASDKRKVLNEKSRAIFSDLLSANPTDLDTKAKLAMTYVETENPMQGIMMLREVVQDDPRNEVAIYNLGLLAIQSGQYDKAVDRLHSLIAINPQHDQAHFFLGVSHAELGHAGEAKEHFETVKKLNSDPAVHSAVDKYLGELNQKK
jgi:outer membrane protein